jgi:uncharacterized membrane protein YhaH (DUF805 family)
MDYVAPLFFSFIGHLPRLLFWIAVLVVSIIILKRSKSRPEKFLVTGAAIGFFGAVLSIVVPFVSLLIGRAAEAIQWGLLAASFSVKAVSLVSIILLICAFWTKFNEHRDIEPGVLKP